MKNTTPEKPMRSEGIVLAMSLLLLVSCQSVKQMRVKDQMVISPETNAPQWVCEAFLPITIENGDATSTIRQVSEHNAVWQALCHED